MEVVGWAADDARFLQRGDRRLVEADDAVAVLAVDAVEGDAEWAVCVSCAGPDIGYGRGGDGDVGGACAGAGGDGCEADEDPALLGGRLRCGAAVDGDDEWDAGLEEFAAAAEGTDADVNAQAAAGDESLAALGDWLVGEGDLRLLAGCELVVVVGVAEAAAGGGAGGDEGDEELLAGVAGEDSHRNGDGGEGDVGAVAGVEVDDVHAVDVACAAARGEDGGVEARLGGAGGGPDDAVDVGRVEVEGAGENWGRRGERLCDAERVAVEGEAGPGAARGGGREGKGFYVELGGRPGGGGWERRGEARLGGNWGWRGRA